MLSNEVANPSLSQPMTSDPTVPAVASASERISFTQAEREAIRSKWFQAGAAKDDIFLSDFLLAAERLNQHPLRQAGLFPIFDVEANKPPSMRVVATIELMSLVAQRDCGLLGVVSTQWVGRDGIWKDFWPDSTLPPVAAKVLLRARHTSDPIDAVAMYSEHVGEGRAWQLQPALLLAKCAKAIALRNAFPLVLSGVFCVEEVDNRVMQAQLVDAGLKVVQSTRKMPIQESKTANRERYTQYRKHGSVPPPYETDEVQERVRLPRFSCAEALATRADYQQYVGTLGEMSDSRFEWAMTVPHLPKVLTPELARYAHALKTLKDAMEDENILDAVAFRVFCAKKAELDDDDDLPDLDDPDTDGRPLSRRRE